MIFHVFLVNSLMQALSRSGKTEVLTNPHRPYGSNRASLQEIKRVRDAGGWVCLSVHFLPNNKESFETAMEVQKSIYLSKPGWLMFYIDISSSPILPCSKNLRSTILLSATLFSFTIGT